MSEAAVAEVAALPWPPDSEARIISIIGFYALAAPEGWLVPESYYENLLQRQQEQARNAVAQAERQIIASNERRAEPLKVSTEIINGDPREAIPQEAASWQADLIVVGSHGWRGLKRWWLGSISSAVLSHAHCSVLIVRHPADQRNQP